MSRRFEDFHWTVVSDEAGRQGSTLVWPFGACEQHGPQLPLSTDTVFAESILSDVLQRLPEDCPIWRLNTQSLGFSPEHQSFPGTISLSGGLLFQLVLEVGSQLAEMGFQRLVLFNAHGGQIGLLQAVARQLRVQAPALAVLPCFLWHGVESLADLIPPEEEEGGLHAGLAETSLMLSIAPGLVGSQRPVDGICSSENKMKICPPPPGWSLEGPAPSAWLTRELSDSGVLGDSRKAGTGLGEEIKKALVEHWVNLFTSLMCSDWPLVRS
nr:creatininase family protein [Prochlorococcus sp. MIT 1341]